MKSPSNKNYTNIKILSYGKQYLFKKNDVKTVYVAQCAKSKALSKFVETIINIGIFDQKCIIIKAVL